MEQGTLPGASGTARATRWWPSAGTGRHPSAPCSFYCHRLPTDLLLRSPSEAADLSPGDELDALSWDAWSCFFQADRIWADLVVGRCVRGRRPFIHIVLKGSWNRVKWAQGSRAILQTQGPVCLP